MPIYLYQREDGSTFEKIQKVSDEHLSVCPETGQKVTRLLSPPALHFKGNGFYKTDYASQAPSKNGESSASESSSKSGEKAEGKSSSEAKSSSACDGSGACASCTD